MTPPLIAAAVIAFLLNIPGLPGPSSARHSHTGEEFIIHNGIKPVHEMSGILSLQPQATDPNEDP
jgi:hypothetical protein